MNERLTIPSRSVGVWRRLYTRYTLEPWPASVSPDVSKTIVPVTQADELLARHGAVAQSSGSVDGTGLFVVATVPAGIRWHIVHMIIFRAVGTFTFADIRANDVSEGILVILDQFSTTTSRILPAQTAPLVLEAGDEVQVNVDVHSVNGALTMQAWAKEEDLF